MTYNEFIKKYLDKGLIKRQKSDFQTAEKFIIRALRELKTARATLSIDEDTAYTIIYSAMLHAGRAFMLSKGFRPADGYQHKTVCEFASQFLDKRYKIAAKKFDDMRRKRNILTYDVSIAISKTEANNAMNTAKEFIELISNIIKKENPQREFNF